MEEVFIFTKKRNQVVSLPFYATAGAAGADVEADLTEPMTILPGQAALVPTGLYCEVPHGYEVQVRPRSGLAFKFQVTVLNSPGTIDSDYRGEIKVLLMNHGTTPFTIEPKMRIAQLVVAAVIKGRFVEQEELSLSSRGDGGFGHTGLKR